jgi:signal transduction histidine kinase
LKKRKNRRTLKKRIRKVISLSTFLTAFILSGLISCLLIFVSRELASYQAETVSVIIQNDIISGRAEKFLGINNLEELQQDNILAKMWLDSFSNNSIFHDFNWYPEQTTNIFVQIEINNAMVYSNNEEDSDSLAVLYRNTQAVKPIIDSLGSQIGEIRVRVNPQIILAIVIPTIVIIIILSITALIAVKILSIFLTLPIINPIRQLEKKVKAIAEGDQDTASNTQLVLKKPLREIESLIDSTNGIMKKLQGYNELLENQKDVLENQNYELEVQNDELLKSKQQIQEQQAQLIQSEKMASVGLLTAAITHEINTPIGAINSNAQLTQMLVDGLLDQSSVRSDGELADMLGQLKEVNEVNLMACGRIIEIIRSLKSFSRLDQADFQEADMNEGIKSVLVLTNNLLKRRITVHEEYGNIPLVKCFPGQLNQVFMNIIVNASQAIEGEGEIFIHTYQEDSSISITIRDTGAGIDQANISKIFEPGFTTKGVGVGLGLGLYISYNIIQNHKGEIEVTSEVGKGTEFTIRIPMNHDETYDKTK